MHGAKSKQIDVSTMASESQRTATHLHSATAPPPGASPTLLLMQAGPISWRLLFQAPLLLHEQEHPDTSKTAQTRYHPCPILWQWRLKYLAKVYQRAARMLIRELWEKRDESWKWREKQRQPAQLERETQCRWPMQRSTLKGLMAAGAYARACQESLPPHASALPKTRAPCVTCTKSWGSCC